MKSWGIKKRVLFLALLPTLLIALSLTIYYSISRINFIEKSLHDKGVLLVNHLAPASEYGVFSGNTNILNNIIDKTLAEEDVVKVIITNAYDEVLISKTKSPETLSRPGSVLEFLINEEQIEFYSDINSSEIDIDDFDELLELDTRTQTNSSQSIGHVYITLSNLNTRLHQLDSILKALIISFIGLILTILLAIKTSKGVVTPIQNLTSSVNKIAQGELNTHINIDSGGEIGSLETGINQMNEELQLVRLELQAQINKATAKLTRTLDELEIQNIELDLARNQAISASKIKSEFLANMSHEIRTPMNGVLGFTNLLSKTNLTLEQKDHVNTIGSSAESLLTVINDILDFSKIESGKLEIENISFNLQNILNDIIKMFTPMAYDKNIELIYHPYPDIPDCFFGDPTRIRQIIINLIGNAIKFTSNGHVIFRAIALGQSDKTINFQFTISDTGIGMDQDHKQRLFGAFSQADTSITRKFGGTGLGLVISKKLAELMNGDIGFESEIDKGSTFWFSVPLNIDQNNLPGLSSSPMVDTSSNVIVFEPLIQNRIATRSLLNQLGINTIETSRIEKIDELIKNNDNVVAIIAGINRLNIKNEYFTSKVSSILQNSNLPHLILASSFDNSEINQIFKNNLNNVFFRSKKSIELKTKILSLIDRKENTMVKENDIQSLNDDPIHSWEHIHVLLVDDSEINLKLVKTLLENHNIKVSTAENGEQAIKLAEQNFYDILFMDLHMPKMDGCQATEHLRKNENPCKKTIIIALTANAMPEEQLHIYDSGMNDILLKPISEQQLFDIFERWLTTEPNRKSTEISKPELFPENPLPIYDKEEGKKLASGNTQLAEELLIMLIKELPEHRKKLEQAKSSNTLTELKNHIHKLHGATSYCGVPHLRSCAKNLENIIDHSDIDNIDSAYQNVLNSINLLLEYTDTGEFDLIK